MPTTLTSRVASGAVAVILVLLAGAAQARPVTGQGTWETTLKGRDIDGNPVRQLSPRAVFLYDKLLHVTWLRDQGTAEIMTWHTSMSWAESLVVGAYDDWRLPFVVDTGTPGCDFSFSGTDCGFNVQTKTGSKVYSELAHLYYETLGNKAFYDTNGTPGQPGHGLTNTGSFLTLPTTRTWFNTEYAPDPGSAWKFETYWGAQDYALKSSGAYQVMAVRPGDVAAVPEPRTHALLLVGLTGLAVVALRRRSQ